MSRRAWTFRIDKALGHLAVAFPLATPKDEVIYMPPWPVCGLRRHGTHRSFRVAGRGRFLKSFDSICGIKASEVDVFPAQGSLNHDSRADIGLHYYIWCIWLVTNPVTMIGFEETLLCWLDMLGSEHAESCDQD